MGIERKQCIRAHGEEQCDAPRWEVDQRTSSRSPQWETGCDDEPILRNEANSSVVSGPLSVVGCSVETIDEPIAPDAATIESHDQDLEAPAPSRDQEAGCDDDGILRNEATIGPLSVVSGPLHVVGCTGEAMVHEPRAANEANAGLENVTNEPTADLENLTNEPKLGADGEYGVIVELITGISDFSLHGDRDIPAASLQGVAGCVDD